MRVPRNPDLENIEDEDLVSLAQEDIDIYRNECDWECSCGNRISYAKSINKLGVCYAHEIRCSDVVDISRKIENPNCKKPMILKNRSKNNFDSIYFNELFSRYQDRIIAEAAKCGTGEDPYDVYAILSGFFMKIVGKFARGGGFKKKSDSWFSSYFWRSIRNKTTDIRKTETYNKRSPTVRCPICEKNVGVINTKHLMSPGHEIIACRFFENIGRMIMEETGEIKYYKEGNELLERTLYLGKMNLLSMKPNDQKKIINTETLRIFNELFPGNIVKNMVFSTNDILYRDSESAHETEIGDLCEEEHSVLFSHRDDVDLRDVVKNIVEEYFKPNIVKFRSHFYLKVETKRKLEIIENIIFDKSSYNMSDKELDLDHKGEAKRGLTSALFKFIKKDKEIKNFLASKLYVSEP